MDSFDKSAQFSQLIVFGINKKTSSILKFVSDLAGRLFRTTMKQKQRNIE